MEETRGRVYLPPQIMILFQYDDASFPCNQQMNKSYLFSSSDNVGHEAFTLFKH